MNENLTDLRYEELLAENRRLRQNIDLLQANLKSVGEALAKLRKAKPPTRQLLTENRHLHEDNERLRQDNERLRQRLTSHRKALPPGVMTFGKYQGQPLTEIPTDALEWYLKNCFDKVEMRRKQSQQLKELIKQELATRYAALQQAPARTAALPSYQQVQEQAAAEAMAEQRRPGRKPAKKKEA